MPYKTNKELPEKVRKSLPSGAQNIFRKAYNNAVKQYKDPAKRRGKATLVETCNKVAWAAVKAVYRKHWLRRKWVKR